MSLLEASSRNASSQTSVNGVRTHEVTNQPPPLVDYNVFEADRVMTEAVRREGAGWAEQRISAVGETPAWLAEVSDICGGSS